MTDEQKHQIKECTIILEAAMVKACLEMMQQGFPAAAVNAAWNTLAADPDRPRDRLHS